MHYDFLKSRNEVLRLTVCCTQHPQLSAVRHRWRDIGWGMKTLNIACTPAHPCTMTLSWHMSSSYERAVRTQETCKTDHGPSTMTTTCISQSYPLLAFNSFISCHLRCPYRGMCCTYPRKPWPRTVRTRRSASTPSTRIRSHTRREGPSVSPGTFMSSLLRRRSEGMGRQVTLNDL